MTESLGASIGDRITWVCIPIRVADSEQVDELVKQLLKQLSQSLGKTRLNSREDFHMVFRYILLP